MTQKSSRPADNIVQSMTCELLWVAALRNRNLCATLSLMGATATLLCRYFKIKLLKKVVPASNLNVFHLINYLCLKFFVRTARANPLHKSTSEIFTKIDFALKSQRTSAIETVQDFLIKLDIKPLMHLLEIRIFSLNNDPVRLTKIMNNLVKDLKILSFKVIFECLN